MVDTSVGRNDACPCGSGKKYKQCCLLKGNSKNLAQGALDINSLVRQAWQMQALGRVGEASHLARRILGVKPNEAEALHILGVIALSDGQVEQAIEYFKKALKKQAENFLLNANLGLAYHEQGNLALAEDYYQKSVKLNPNDSNVLFNLHALKISSVNLTQSIDLLKKLSKINPTDHEAKSTLAILLDYAGHHEASVNLLAEMQPLNAVFEQRLSAWEYLKKQRPMPQITGSMVKTFEMALQAANVEGLVMEFGVRHGNSIRQLAKLAPHQQIHGFDSFEGLPENWHAESKGAYTTQGVLPQVPKNVKLHIGWFDESLPKFLAIEQGSVRLVNIDCDLYSSTKTVLDLLAPRLVAGSVLIFDEYIGNEHWQEDEYKAFKEAVEQYGWKYQYLAFSFFTKQVVVKLL